MKSLVWADEAKRHLFKIGAYIARDIPSAARTVRTRIESAARLLASHPVGRPGRVEGTFERTV